MRLAIPTLILAVVLVLGWRVCSGGDADHLKLTESDLPAELREGYQADDSASEPSASAASDQNAQGDPEIRKAEDALGDGVADAEAAEKIAEVAAPSAPPQAGQSAEPAIELPSAAVEDHVGAGAVTTAARAPAAVKAPAASAPQLPAVSAAETAGDAAAGDGVYVVKPGDWLMQIARDQFGDASRAKEIARLNGLHEPYKLKPGQELILP